MKKILILIFIFSGALAHSQSKNVLFVGNSFVLRNNLPQLVGNIAASMGDNLNFGNVSIANSTLSDHSTDPNCLKEIRRGGWDYVVLQEYSTFPSNPIDWVTQNVYPFAKLLSDEAHAYNPGGKTMFYMTWGRENGDPDRCPYYPAVCTYTGMDDLTRARYMEMALNNNGVLSPVGAVWRYIRENYPLIKLYDTDGNHPSEAGSYAAACCFYTAIFRKDPMPISFNFTLPAADAAQIRTAVKLIVFDNLTTWHLEDTKAPAVPAGLAAGANTETGFTLTWAPSSDDVGVTGYDVYLDGALIKTVTTTFADITGLIKASSYVMTVSARDAAGNTSASSSPFTVSTSDFQGKIMLTVAQAAANNKVYDATTVAALNTSAATLTGIVSPDIVSLVSAGAVGSFSDLNIGTSKAVLTNGFTLTGADASKYVLIQPVLTAAISVKPIQVTATAGQGKVYGSDNPDYTYSLLPALLGGDSFNGLLSRITGEDAGFYAITRGTLYAGSNYSITFSSSDFTITAKPITVTATSGQSKIFGAVDPVFLFSFLPVLVGSDFFAGALSRVTGENVGDYAITQGTLSAGSNYSITFVSNNFHIGARPVLITAGAGQTKVYGQTDPAFTFSASPVLQTGDSFTGALQRVAGEDAGTYPFTLGNLSAGLNYSLSLDPAARFTITTKQLNITGLTANNKTYDGNTSATLSGTATLNGVVSPDVVTLGGTPVATFASSAVADNIPVTVTGYTISGADAGNYTLTQPAGLMADITIVNDIEDISGKFECTVYPNPVTDFVTLSISNYDIEKLSYMLFDGMGNLLGSRKLTSNKTVIPMQSFISGTYFIKISNAKEVVRTIKIIKN